MKIALIGAHKTGKTTVFELLKPHLQDFHFIPEVIQEFNYNTTSHYEYMYIQERVLSTQMHQESQHSNVVCDRSLIDNFAYMVASCYKYKPLSHQYCDIIGDLTEKSMTVVSAIEKFNDYAYLFYFPPLPDTKPKHKEYQELIDHIIKYLLYQYDIIYTTLTGTPEERVQKILQYIGEK